MTASRLFLKIGGTDITSDYFNAVNPSALTRHWQIKQTNKHTKICHFCGLLSQNPMRVRERWVTFCLMSVMRRNIILSKNDKVSDHETHPGGLGDGNKLASKWALGSRLVRYFSSLSYSRDFQSKYTPVMATLRRYAVPVNESN